LQVAAVVVRKTLAVAVLVVIAHQLAANHRAVVLQRKHRCP
jgi:hypothetical protein